jgi:hypothetical protein
MLSTEHDAHPLISRELLETEHGPVRSEASDRCRPFLPFVIEIVVPNAGHVAVDSMDREPERPRTRGELDARGKPSIENYLV